MPLRDHLRDGSISLKVANFSNKTLRQTRAQKSKETNFDNKSKTDERRPPSGALPKREINAPEYQKTVKGMPSRGAGVQGRETPSRGHIDDYPSTQSRTFPAGANYAGGPSPKTGNTKMKVANPGKSGGVDGHNARSPRYYGGPKTRQKENG